MDERGWRSAWGPLFLVAAIVVLQLVALRGEVAPVADLNDAGLHVSMMGWAEDRIAEGHLPLDGWLPGPGLGSAQFHQYQSLPHLISGAVARVGGEPTDIYKWTLYLLLATWPLSAFIGARLLGFTRWAAAASAAIAPLLVSAPGYGLEAESYVWRGLGLWPQLWAMWLLPIGIGASFRAVVKGKGLVLAASVMSLTIACHFMTGYIALLALPVLVVVGQERVRTRAIRAVTLASLALLASAWSWFPLVAERDWVNLSPAFSGDFWLDSFGANQVLAWLVSGELFDAGRLPVVTLAAAAGLAVAAVRLRADASMRFLVGFGSLSLVLFFGRPTLGPLLDLLPGSEDLMLHRVIVGVHLVGVLLAGLGMATVIERLAARSVDLFRNPFLTIVTATLLAAGGMAPALIERARWLDQGRRWIDQQAVAEDADRGDLLALIRQADEAGGGRIYAGDRTNWGGDYRIGFVPAYAIVAERQAEGIGFTYRTVASLSTDVEPLFDETIPDHYRIYGVRYLLLPGDRTPEVPARRIASRGRHALWAVDETHVSVVDIGTGIEADRTSVAEVARGFLERPGVATPVLSFGGRTPALDPSKGDGTLPGAVLSFSYEPNEGHFAAEVELDRRAAVVVSQSFHPRWEVRVDGELRPTAMMAPAFIGTEVSPGRHEISFRYRTIPYQLPLLLLGLGSLLAAASYERKRKKLGPAQEPPAGDGSSLGA